MKRLSKLHGRALKFASGFCRATAPGRAGARALNTGSRLRALLRSGSDGQSLVEFALVVPVLALLLTGVFWIGINMCNYLALNDAVEVGARYLAIEGNTTGNSTNNLADPCQAVFTQMMGSASTLDPSKISVSYTFNGSTIGPFIGTAANTCPSDSGSFGSGGTFTIVATYPCTGGIYKANLSGCQITVSSPPNQTIYTNGS
jgi:Flp pilus assembly protein TadG